MVWGCSSAGEHFVDIEGVTGSIPVTPTISSKRFLKQRVSFDADVAAFASSKSFSYSMNKDFLPKLQVFGATLQKYV